MHASSAGWLSAQGLDGGFISDYARDNPTREDIAESFLLWMAVRYRKDKISAVDFNRITTVIPNRLKYFDGIDCNLNPFKTDTTTRIKEFENGNEVVLYPNPATDFIFIKAPAAANFRVTVYNAVGKVVLAAQPLTSQSIDFSELNKGLYFIVLHFGDKQIRRKILKL